jgi:hypothetical protein
VPAVLEQQAGEGVPVLQQRHEDRHVRLRARVRLDVGVRAVEEGLGALAGERLDLVHVGAPAVVAAPGYPSAYLLVKQVPAACITAGLAWFSLAISSIVCSCRERSRSRIPAASGSVEAIRSRTASSMGWLMRRS